MAGAAVSPELSWAWSASPSYVWEVPGKPVIVHVALKVVDRLDREIVESFRSLQAEGAEIGGLLLGAVQGSSPFEVFIHSYEVIPSEYKRGPLYKLSPRDLERFEAVLEQRAGAAMQIVGFFRSHTRKGLGLDTEDVAIFNRFFPKQYQVALLAKPFATKLTAGAIFIREGRSLRSESSYKEFHFRTSTVERRGACVATLKGGAKASLEPAAVERVAAPVHAPVEPGPDDSTKWAPTVIAIEQNSALPAGDAPPKRRSFGPIWIALSAMLMAILRAVKPLCVAASGKLLATLRAARRISIAASAKLLPAVRAVRPLCISVAGKLAGALRVVRPTWMGASTRLTAAVRAARPMWIAGGSAAALVVFSSLLYFVRLHRTTSPVATSARNASMLSFRVERSAGELFLTWNKDADVIHEATHAVLAIADGERKQSVNLDQAQLRHGRIVYLSYNPEINFQLKVTGRKSSQTQSEFVRVLRVSPWAKPELQRASPQKPLVKRLAPNALALIPSKASEGPGAGLAKAPKQSAVRAAGLDQTLGSASALDLPDAPVLTFGQLQAISTPGNIATRAGIPLSAFPLPWAAPPDIPQPRVGGHVSEAQILTQTSPEYPLAAKQARVQGAVVVRAIIGVNGHIKSATALSGPSLLQNPAVAAVNRWVYKPATLNGAAVESETRIELKFELQH